MNNFILDARIDKLQFTDSSHIVKSAVLRKLLRLPPITKNPVLIKDISLQIKQGEIVSFVGSSGAGKTTFLRVLAGLETEYTGQVIFDASIVTKPSRNTQVVFQDSKLLPWLNVRNNIAFAVENLSKSDRESRISEWLERADLTHLVKAFPKNLSGGEESRVAFVRVFIEPPQLLLLDEPFRALDPVTKFDLQDHFLQFVSEKKLTALIVSHSIDDAVYLSDRVIVLGRNPLHIHDTFAVTQTRPRVRGDVSLTGISVAVAESLRRSMETKNTGGLGVL